MIREINKKMDSDEEYLYEKLVRNFTLLIDRGGIAPGERLPSVRKLSAELGISMSVVLQAYWLLESRDYIEARPQSGYYARTRTKHLLLEPQISRPGSCATKINIWQLAASAIEAAYDPGLVDLGAAKPCSGLLPGKQLARVAGKICRDNEAAAIASSAVEGYAPLRKQISRRSVEWGGNLSPDEIITTNGGMEGLSLCLRAIARPGGVVAVESPTFYGVLQAIESLGMLALEIPTHPGYGISLPALQAAAKKRRIDACLLIPNFNNPMGSLMPEESKKELAAFIARERIPLIEDDICGELYFGQARPGTVKSYDKSGLVMLCSSFSKTVAPGYRVGWIAAGEFLQRIKQLRLMTSLVTGTLPQIILAEFMNTPAYDRHVRQLRKTLSMQSVALTTAIEKAFPANTRITRPQGGLALWVELPTPINGVRLQREALANGIHVLPGIMFSTGKKYRNCLRLAYGQSWSKKTEAAVAVLGKLAAAHL